MIDEKKIIEEAEAVFEETFDGNEVGFAYYDNDPEEPMFCEAQVRESFTLGAQWAQVEFVNSLWHDASEEPRKGANCILYVSYEFEEEPEENYREYTTGVYLGGGFSEDHFPSEADVYTIKWAYLDDILPKEGGEE